jgi:ADP-ribosyl-[dinitrogen reductase] hydrolase
MRGCLAGQAIGDALAVPFATRKLQAPMFPDKTVLSALIEMTGGGARQLLPGQVTWATQQVTALATELRIRRKFDLHAVSKAYVRWFPHSVDAPALMKVAVGLIEETGWPLTAGKRAWLETHRQFFDAGALMRSSAMAVLYPTQREARVDAVLADAALTHFAPICQLANVAMSGLLAAAFTTPAEHLSADEGATAMETNLLLGADVLARKEPDWVLTVQDAAAWLRADIEAARKADPELYGPELHLFQAPDGVRLSFRLALWEFFHLTSFEEALVDVVHRGGAANLHSSLTGAIAGAVFGEREIPTEWHESVFDGPPGLSGPLATTYHPSNLVLLAGVGYDPLAKEPELPVWGRDE